MQKELSVDTTQQRRAKIQKWANVGLIGLAGLLVSPVIFMAIGGLIGLAVAAVAGLSIVTFTPWVTMKFANWKVKAIAAEAADTPIETMTNLLIEQHAAFNRFTDDVTAAVAGRNVFAEKCKQFAIKYPARAGYLNQQLAHITSTIEQKKQALSAAQDALELGESKLDEMKAYFDMATAMNTANKSANLDTGDIYKKLKMDTACDSVFLTMSSAFARMEVVSALDDTASLEYNPTEVLDVQVSKKVTTR